MQDQEDEEDLNYHGKFMLDKKKLKKWRKRLEIGGVNSTPAFLTTKYRCNLLGEPNVELSPEGIKLNSHKGLQLTDLRNLLTAVLLDQNIQNRCFNISNKGFIRYILHIHVENVEDERGFLYGLRLGEVVKFKVSTERDRIYYLPYKLLTVPLEDDFKSIKTKSTGLYDGKVGKGQVSNDLSRLQELVLSKSLARLWNYPEIVDVEVPFKLNTGSDSGVGDDEDQLNKKRRTDHLSSSSVSVIPSVDHSHMLLEKLKTHISVDVRYCTDFPHCFNLITEKEFYSTLSEENKVYEDLWLSEEKILRVYLPLNVAALDCEMVKTSKGLEVCRVTVLSNDDSLVNTPQSFDIYRGCTILLDCFVQPQGQVLDYCTEHSGITREILDGATKVTFEQMRASLLRILSAETLLIGHSLDSDLRVLRLMHNKLIDTAILFPHLRGFPLRRKLKHLAKDLLQMDIQGSNRQGHDSREDAFAALQLVMARVEKGPKFGVFANKQRVSVFKTWGKEKGKPQCKMYMHNGYYPNAKQLLDGKLKENGTVQSVNDASTIEISGVIMDETEVKEVNDDGVEIKAALEVIVSARSGFVEGLEDIVDGEVDINTVQGDVVDVIKALQEEVIKFREEQSRIFGNYFNGSNHEMQQSTPKGQTFFLFSSLSGDDSSIKELLLGMKSSLRTTSSMTSEKGLLLISTQHNSSVTKELLRKRRALSSNALSTIRWTAEQERQLQEETGRSNVGFATMQIL